MSLPKNATIQNLVKISGVAMGMGARHMCSQTPVSLFDDYCLFYCLFHCLSYCLSYCLFYCLFKYCSFYCSSYIVFILKLMLYPINNVSKQPCSSCSPCARTFDPPCQQPQLKGQLGKGRLYSSLLSTF